MAINRFDRAFNYAKQICYSTENVLRFSYDIALRYKESYGIMIETGVAAGAQIIMMAAACPDKEIFAFDSFMGICLPSNRDDQMPGIRKLTKAEQMSLPDPGKQELLTTGATSVSKESFMFNIVQALRGTGVDYDNIVPVEGWFEETIPKWCDEYKFMPATGIDVLRLDGDLYNSTYVALKYLFPRTIEGSCVIIDDWQLKGCRDACEEYFESIGYRPDYKFIDNVAYFFV